MSDDDLLEDAPTALWTRPASPGRPPPPLSPSDAVRDAVREETRELRELLRELLADPRRRDDGSPWGPGEPRYLNPCEAARMAGVKTQTIQRWVRAGKLRGHHAGRVVRIRSDELRVFLERGGEASDSGSDADLDARATSLLKRKKMLPLGER